MKRRIKDALLLWAIGFSVAACGYGLTGSVLFAVVIAVVLTTVIAWSLSA